MKHIWLRILAVALTIVWMLLLNFWMMPAINIQSTTMWLMVILTLVGGAVIMWCAEYFIGDDNYRGAIVCILLVVTVVVLMAILSVPSWNLFNAGAFRDVVNIKQEDNTLDDLPKVESAKDIPIVDMYTARQLGDRTMGAMSKYSSQYEVNQEYNLISFNGSYVRISPLEYGDFWKWNTSKRNGIPGYVTVNVYTQEAKFVQPEKSMFYSPSAGFGDKLKRHLLSLYPSYMMEKAHFEVDDEGVQYYVVPVVRATAGLFGAMEVYKVILCNAETGDAKEYNLDEVPMWVDHVFSVEYIMERLDWHYKYVHGFWNTWFAKKDIKGTSYSYDNAQYFFIPKDGDVFLYTGITSSGTDESNFGFILANMRTGEIRYYDDIGAEESSAQSSAEGLVQNLGYKAGPVMAVTVDGVSTYFMTLKDKGGLVKKVAFVNKANYTIAAEADTIEQALKLYRSKIKGEIINEETETKDGIVNFLFTAVKEGTTFFYFKIEGDNTLYASSLLTNEVQVTMFVGSKINFTYNILDKDLALVQKITIK